MGSGTCFISFTCLTPNSSNSSFRDFGFELQDSSNLRFPLRSDCLMTSEQSFVEVCRRMSDRMCVVPVGGFVVQKIDEIIA